METKFNFKCPICGRTTLNTNVVRTLMSGRMCMDCFLKTQDDMQILKGENMSEFNFKSAICTSREQSERLLALGLKKETADMYWTKPFGDWIAIVGEGNIDENNIPAWSLHRLWELLPKSFWYDNGLEKKYHPIIEYGFVNYVTECGMELFDFDCGYEVWGSMIVVIEWLIKEGYFNKEYLV